MTTGLLVTLHCRTFRAIVVRIKKKIFRVVDSLGNKEKGNAWTVFYQWRVARWQRAGV
ncbi:MAG: hypothetical protein RL336_1027 [Pseudomonadota bacterium]|jgi:hypothetical protein